MHQGDMARFLEGRGYDGGGILGLAGELDMPDVQDVPSPAEAMRQTESLVRERGGQAVRSALSVGAAPRVGTAAAPPPGRQARGRAAETWDGCVIRTHPVLGRYSPACRLAGVGAARVETGGRFSLLSHKVRGTSRVMRMTMDGTVFVQMSYEIRNRSRPLAEGKIGRDGDPEWRDGWVSDVSWPDNPSKPPLVVVVGATAIPIGPRIAAGQIRDAVTWWPGTAIPGYDPMIGHPLDQKEAQIVTASESIARRHVSAGLRGDALLAAIRQDQIALAVRTAGGDLPTARMIAGRTMRPDHAIWREMEAARPGPAPPAPAPAPGPAPQPIPDGADAGGGIRVIGIPLWAVAAGAAVVALVGILVMRRRQTRLGGI